MSLNIEADLVDDEKKRKNTRGKDIGEDDVNDIGSRISPVQTRGARCRHTSFDGDGAPEDDILAEVFSMIAFQSDGTKLS